MVVVHGEHALVERVLVSERAYGRLLFEVVETTGVALQSGDPGRLFDTGGGILHAWPAEQWGRTL